jgi:thioesterase domain-containing protein/acyl carrier protein
MSEIASNPARTAPSLSEMLALWQRMLSLPAIGPDDDFFDLGGDSLLALNLFHELERTTGRQLPITAIYDAATPAKLLALLGTASAAPFSPLVLLKPGSDTPALHIVHGVGGNVIELERLGRLIDTARPVYGVQARGVDGGAAPFDTVAAMADYDLAAIRAIQPHGPYFLAGFSFGGLVALEMARRLGEAGERVAFLALIDSFPHPDAFPKWLRQLVRLRVTLHAFATMKPGAAIDFLIGRVLNPGVASSQSALMLANLDADNVTPALRAVFEATFRALVSYRPRRYPGAITFFRPAVSIFPIAPRRYWGKLVAALDLVPVAGDHDGMVREDAASLAAALSRRLRHVTGEES